MALNAVLVSSYFYQTFPVIIDGLVNEKVRFKTANGIEQGTCESIANYTHCNVKVGPNTLKIPVSKLILK